MNELNRPAQSPQPAYMPVAFMQYYPTRCGYMFPCIVLSDGSFELGPYGWDVTRQGTGIYKITHNLGRLDYMPLACVAAGGDYKLSVAILERTTTTVTVRGTDSTQLADASFMLFIVGL